MLSTCLLIYDDQKFFPGVTANFTEKRRLKPQLNSKGRNLSFHFFRFYYELSKVRFYDFFFNWNDFINLDYYGVLDMKRPYRLVNTSRPRSEISL